LDAQVVRAIASKELADILSQRVYWLAFALELIVVLGIILLGVAFASLANPDKTAYNLPALGLQLGLLESSRSPSGQIILDCLVGERIELRPLSDLDAARREVESDRLMGAIVIGEENRSDQTIPVLLLTDPSKPYESVVRARVENAVEEANERLSSLRVASLGLEGAASLSVSASFVGRSSLPMSSPDFVEAMYLMIVPLVLILPILLSANITSDSIVGEKEAGTLGILMASPVSRFDIILGKVLPVLGLANLQLVAWIFLLENNLLGRITIFNKGPLLLLLNLGGLCFIGATVVVSAKSESSKESNLYLTLLVIALIFPLLLGLPDLGPATRIVDDLLLVRLIANAAASPRLPLGELAGDLCVLGGAALVVLGACVLSIKGLEPPPSR